MRAKPKDFSILLSKVSTTNAKKDISLVSGFNKIVQQVDQSAKVNKGELMADPYFGSNMYQYIFDGLADIAMMRTSIQDSIEYGIPDIFNISVELIENTGFSLIFDVNFSTTDYINSQTDINCVIEVPTA